MLGSLVVSCWTSLLSAALPATGSENGRSSWRPLQDVWHWTPRAKTTSGSRGLQGLSDGSGNVPPDRLDDGLAGSLCLYPPRQHSSTALEGAWGCTRCREICHCDRVSRCLPHSGFECIQEKGVNELIVDAGAGLVASIWCNAHLRPAARSASSSIASPSAILLARRHQASAKQRHHLLCTLLPRWGMWSD